jgi:DSF synthase
MPADTKAPGISALQGAGATQFSLGFDGARHTLWVRCHPTPAPRFTHRFIDEVLAMQRRLTESHGVVSASNGEIELKWLVYASAVPNVFNLGGDLPFFLQCAREQDSEALYRYARSCIEICLQHARAYGGTVSTIALVQGMALGGGFESALSSQWLVAEESAKFALPETKFSLFPGMGAFNLLARRMPAREAERIVFSEKVYSAAEMMALGGIDLVVPDGQGVAAVEDWIDRYPNGRPDHCMRDQPVTEAELDASIRAWVETAIRMDASDIKLIERLIRSQEVMLKRTAAKPAP